MIIRRRKTNPQRWVITDRGWIAIWTLVLVAALAGGLALPCETENSHNCTWYAGVQGNGEGRTFTDVLTLVKYWD